MPAICILARHARMLSAHWRSTSGAPAAEAASAAASCESALSQRTGVAAAAADARSDWNAVMRTRWEHSAPPCSQETR